MSKEIFSLEYEKNILGGLLRNPHYYFEVDNFLSEMDFYNATHQTIFCVLQQMIQSQETVEKLVVAEKIKSLGISLEISPFEYIRALNVINISLEGFITCVKELKKLTVRRTLREDFIQAAKEMESATNLSYNEIIAKAESRFNNSVNLYSLENEPTDLFGDIVGEVEELGNNPQEEVGLKIPYKRYMEWFGGFTDNNITVICAPQKTGKSTFLLDTAFKIATECNPETKVRVLFLDTEMDSFTSKARAVGAKANISDWYIRSGQFRKNEELLNRVRGATKMLSSHKGIFYHLYVGGMGIDEIVSVAKRWKGKYVKKDEKMLLVYDYLKLTSADKPDNANPETALLGKKIDSLKRLSSTLHCHVLTACQMSRSGNVAASARIAWFTSFLFFLEKRTNYCISKNGAEFGTHALRCEAARYHGRDQDEANGKLIRITNERGEKELVANYLLFKFDKFNCEEVSSLDEMMRNGTDLKAEKSEDSGKLLED